MSVVRAWKDPEYRLSLSVAELAMIPANPAGVVDLTDAAVDGVAGGTVTPIPTLIEKSSWNCVSFLINASLQVCSAAVNAITPIRTHICC